MDIATLLGLISGIAVIVWAIASSASLLDFVNPPGMLIVIGGTIAVTLLKYRLKTVLTSFRLAFRTVFTDRTDNPIDLITKANELAQVVRKQGILGLEDLHSDNPFMQQGMMLCVDGHQPEFIEEFMEQETQQTMERYDAAEGVFRGIGDSAPALGMLGTLVGLVQMLNTLDDPSSIGPAMAIALLTTFYGAFIAQIMALPMADKLQLKATEERRNMSLITACMQGILKGQNPRVMEGLLGTYLPPEQRLSLPSQQRDL